MPILPTGVSKLKRQFPHADEIADYSTQQTVRLLWDRIFDLEERLQARATDISNLIDGHNKNERMIEDVESTARLALTQGPLPTVPGVGGGTGGEAPPPGGDDGGEAQSGCSAGLPSGHDSGGLLTAIRAGQIVCGTGNEWIALRNPTADLATRLSNAEELLLRIIWHLRLAGFQAGRQRNPSNLISGDKITVVVNGVLRAYDIFINLDGFTIQMGMHMGEVFPANMVDTTGTAD